MSGRALHARDGELITNRKTDRRQSKSRLPAKGDYCLRFLVPEEVRLGVAPGATGIAGVSIVEPGPYVEVRGKDRDWTLQQAAIYLGSLRAQVNLEVTAILQCGSARYARELVYVPGASVVFLHRLKRALVFPVRVA